MNEQMMRQRQERAKMRLLEHARFLDAPIVTLKVISKEQVKADIAEAKIKRNDEARRLLQLEVMEQVRASGDIYGDGDI